MAVPCLFIIGKNDKNYNASKAVEKLNQVAPNIKTKMFPNAGHDITYVLTKEVNKEILNFLK